MLKNIPFIPSRGVSEYIFDFSSRIDILLLNHLDITNFNQLIFDTSRLHDFLSQTDYEFRYGCLAVVVVTIQDTQSSNSSAV